MSVIQTAEGSLNQAHDLLQRVRDLTVQAGNDSNNAESRAAIMNEIGELGKELSRIADNANFNGIDLLSDAAGGTSLTFQVGAGADESNQISVNLFDLSAVGGEIEGLTDISAATVGDALDTIDAQIASVSSARAEMGATQNRLESAINSINVSRENLSAAESRIRDVDMAAEMTNFTRSNILSQAYTAMLAQANQSTQGVLQLLG